MCGCPVVSPGRSGNGTADAVVAGRDRVVPSIYDGRRGLRGLGHRFAERLARQPWSRKRRRPEGGKTGSARPCTPLPAARIVHVTRHPLASCYAMFKTLFKDGYPFSYDLDDTARYYVGYRRLMDHWRQSMPSVIYDISYERLVRGPAGIDATELSAQ